MPIDNATRCLAKCVTLIVVKVPSTRTWAIRSAVVVDVVAINVLVVDVLFTVIVGVVVMGRVHGYWIGR